MIGFMNGSLTSYCEEVMKGYGYYKGFAMGLKFKA